MNSGRRIEIRGTVQGVGFRPWVYRIAQDFGVGGRVHNGPEGVTIEAFGAGADLDAFVRRLQDKAPPAARIRELRCSAIPSENVAAFSIVHSRATGTRALSIPPDLATCPECAAELRDPMDRRYRYAFTNCTACGPRYTIATDVPYDRPATTMASFPMCPACRAEYESVDDRRFHAQPNACPVCGPRLWLVDGSGQAIDADPIAEAGRRLIRGEIVAVKGLGGFHLACDARSEAAVGTLRRRKRRDAKPFAVMVRDLAAANELAVVTDDVAALLSSPERPITLASRRETGVAGSVAPDTDLLGVFLPYTPLHHLLLEEVDGPLVMTSANRSDEPIACDNDEALARLGDIADALILHDRPIAGRCDDSVARIIGGAPALLRRSRGYVPRAVPLRVPVARPVLAVGGHMKNVICLAAGDSAWLGPHVGDMETPEAVDFFEETIDRMRRMLAIEPEVVAYDLHPAYGSTRYALSHPRARKVAVQHHHAHVASAIAEHGIAGTVLGIAFDGTGFGTDGTTWGGEVMRADVTGFERIATFRPLPLPGGDTAIRQVWRIALALVTDAFGEQAPLDALPLFRSVAPVGVRVALQMIERGLNAPRARGVGRYFDAVGALVLARPESRCEGQIAMALEACADPNVRGAYGFSIDRDRTPWEIDLRPAVRDLVADVIAGSPAPSISARFHNTIVEATAAVARAALSELGEHPVVLTGGCFQNARLSVGLRRALADHRVVVHREVPPGDGGLALGQAVVADALTRGGA